MASDTKRVGIVFKADGTVNFAKSLKEVNAELKANYDQLKLTQSEYDRSTTATQKLEDKQASLTNAISLQTEKVAQLQEILDTLNSKEEKNATAIAQAESNLRSAQSTLNRYNHQLEEVNKQLENGKARFEEYSKKVTDVGDKMEKAGKKMSVASGTAAAGITVAAKSAIDFESAFTGVLKTVDGTDEQLSGIKQGILDLAKSTGTSSAEIAEVAENAGQLGIATENIMQFTETMVRMGDSSNVSASEAASSIAKLYNVMGSDINTVDRFGSTIIALGNNAATTESDIINMATRIASSGKQIGLSEQQVLALATTLSSVGLEAEGGGSAISTVMTNIDKAVALNSETLSTWASVAGMSISDFKNTWQNDAMTALQAVVRGMGDASVGGQNLNVILDDLGVSSIRQTDTMKRLSTASGLMSNMVDLANQSWAENNALVEESDKRYGTTEASIGKMRETANEMMISFGELILPTLQNILDHLSGLFNWINSLDDGTKNAIVTILMVIATLGPLLTIGGKFISGIGTIIKLMPLITAALSSPLTPVMGIIAGITALIAIIVTLWNKCEWFRNLIYGFFDGLGAAFRALGNTFIFIANGIIDVFNMVKSALNTIAIDIPDYVPFVGGQRWGFNLPMTGHMAYLAKGGELLSGAAIVAEAGPELLLQQGTKTRVMPLNSQTNNNTDIFDYDRFYKVFIKALSECKMKLDRNGFVKFIDDRIWEAVK